MKMAHKVKGSFQKKAHPGFKAAAASIEQREGVSRKAAGAILAAGARKASAGARKANPRLKRVGGMKRK